MNKTLDSYIQKIGTFKPNKKEEKIIFDTINKLNIYLKLTRDIVFICTHNSRRSIYCEVWANILANRYVKNINFYSAGSKKTSVYGRVIKSFTRLGIESKGNILQLGQKSILLKSKTLDEIQLDTFISIYTCSKAEKSCPIDTRSLVNIPLLFEDPKRFDGLKNEGSEYDKTCSQIAEKINFILERIN